MTEHCHDNPEETQELDIRRLQTGLSHLVEANAGTGKTYAIANLALRFVLAGLPVQQMLVVTFTRDATDELRGRIRARLAEARAMLQSGQPPASADPFFADLPAQYPAGEARQAALDRLELALLEIHEAAVHTIHGFCQQVLGDMALSSGQVFELEQADDSELIEGALRDWWRRRTYPLDENDHAILQAFMPALEDLKPHVIECLKNPELHCHPDAGIDSANIFQRIQQTLAELSRAWRREHTRARALLLDNSFPLDRRRHKIPTLENRLDRFDKALLSARPKLPEDDCLQAFSVFHFKAAASEEDRQKLELDFVGLCEQLKQLLSGETRAGLLVSEIQAATEYVREATQQIKQQRGLLSFDDMIVNLHRALCNDSSAARHFAEQLARLYPLILVDEFQDTDPLQYEIFQHIHRAGRPEHSLILIGDPKQAIYAFRGGDIFTYMQARRQVDRRWNLSVNWRSTAAMIEAVNQVFDGANPFTYADIPYHASHFPQSGNDKAQPLYLDGEEQAALRIEELPQVDGRPLGNKNEAESHVHRSVARHIARLLQPGRARLGERPLQAADIAILVNSHAQGLAVRQALQEQGVRAVTAGRDSIWQSAEAEALLRLLEAALLPTDRNLQRQAMAGDMFNLRYDEIFALMNDAARWEQWVALLAQTGQHWRQHGFMAAFHHLLQGLDAALQTDACPAWLNRVASPERCMTNLLHLADLLQTASREQGSGEQLLQWMRHRQRNDSEDDAELRLESDARLVRILTIHKSKGLQYPVVFAPYLWGAKAPRQSPSKWHQPTDTGYRHCYAPLGDALGHIEHCHESLAESVRLTYVALTRAQSHCHLYFGAAGSLGGKSALAWLASGQTHDFTTSFEDKTVTAQAFARSPDIEILAPDETGLKQNPATQPADTATLQSAAFTRPLRTDWRIGSFSAMTRDTHQATRAPAASGEERFALRYPAGAHVGNFLHSLLENLDPAQPLDEQISRMAPWLFRRHGIGEDDTARDLDGITAWMRDVLHTPLDGAALTLAKLPQERSLHELAFDLATGPVDASALDALLRAQQPDSPALQFERFQGMLTGVIDLVFEYEGRYYIADYKSNLLGRRQQDYAPDILQQEILNRRYDLQYLLYTLALHRHLRLRLGDEYSWQEHFGGVYYLFLRAMTPPTGNRYGIYYTRPDAELIDAMDKIFSPQRVETA